MAKIKLLTWALALTIVTPVVLGGCAPSEEGATPKPNISDETKNRFQPTGTGTAASGNDAAAPDRGSSPPPAPPPGN